MVKIAPMTLPTLPTLLNIAQMSVAIALLVPACWEWWRVWRHRRDRIALALLLTDVFVALAAVVRLAQIAAGTAQTWGDVIVWVLGGNIALLQFALSRGWFLSEGIDDVLEQEQEHD